MSDYPYMRLEDIPGHAELCEALGISPDEDLSQKFGGLFNRPKPEVRDEEPRRD